MVVGDVAASKAALRRRFLDARRAMTVSDRAAAAESLTRLLLGLPEVGEARCVAAYHSFGTEPSTSAVLRTLGSRGVRLLLPVLRPDRDLDWAIYDPEHPAPQDHGGMWSPPGHPLGRAAVALADVVVVPALAVDRGGIRLGRGGGSYDRALARVASDRAVVALLYAGELVDQLPAAPHDRPVTVVVQPGGARRLDPSRSGSDPTRPGRP